MGATRAEIMDVIEYTERFGLIEERLGLFDDVANGVRWWDPVRYEVHSAVHQRLVGAQPPAIATPRLIVRAGRLLTRLALSTCTSSELRALANRPCC